MTDSVLMELVSDPSIQRYFSARSAALQNPTKWREVNRPAQSAAITEKKNGAVVAVSDPQATLSEFTNPTEPSGVIDGLRKQYEEKFGKKPDGRWKMRQLVEKINETAQ